MTNIKIVGLARYPKVTPGIRGRSKVWAKWCAEERKFHARVEHFTYLLALPNYLDRICVTYPYDIICNVQVDLYKQVDKKIDLGYGTYRTERERYTIQRPYSTLEFCMDDNWVEWESKMLIELFKQSLENHYS